MGVCALRDDSFQTNAVATDVFDDAGDGGNGCDDAKLAGVGWRGGGGAAGSDAGAENGEGGYG